MIIDAPAAEVLENVAWRTGHGCLLDELTRLVDLSSEETGALAALHGMAEAVAPALTEAFEGRLAALSADGRVERFDQARLHRVIGQWFLALFGGQYDETYVRRRLAIGVLLAKRGVPVRYPQVIVGLTREFGEQVTTCGQSPETALRAFRKVLSLDVEAFRQVYEVSRRAG